MENYEQKYKEAIERCKSWIRGEHPECFTEAQKAGEFIFPELRESEDERIRKGLIKGLSAMRDIHKHQTFSDDAINIDDAIAWLEKQGEQKPADKIDTYCQENCKGYRDTGGKCFADGECEAKKKAKQKSFWSEEDEKMYQSIIDDTVQKYLLDGNQFAWLKSIKDRVQPQPKQEWSEEDELMLESTIQSLRLTNGAAQMKIDWLKSLKPNHWKPSEEQMEIIDMILTNESMDDNVSRILRELKEQLEKL